MADADAGDAIPFETDTRERKRSLVSAALLLSARSSGWPER